MYRFSKYMDYVLKVMFEVVEADFDSFKFDERWYCKHEWTEEQQNWFKLWLMNQLVNRKFFRGLFGNCFSTDKNIRERAATMFILNYGWKTKQT